MRAYGDLTAELILAILAEEAGPQGWVAAYGVHNGLVKHGFDKRQPLFSRITHLQRTLVKQGLLQEERCDFNPYIGDRYFRLTDQGHERLAELQQAGALQALPALGVRHRVSPLAERAQRLVTT